MPHPISIQRLLFVSGFFLLFCKPLAAQDFLLSGKISAKKEVLAFATVMVKGSAHVTTSNGEGNYSLKLPAGDYDIVVQYIGYKKKTIHISLQSNTTLPVELEEESIALSEVIVKAGEDPAYPIMRAAIKKRKFYQEQVEAYSCKAYIKGLQKIKSVPKNIVGLLKLFGGEPSDTSDIKGVIYLSESESRYYYRRPEEKEIMFSSKVSGDNRSFSFNKISDMKLNFYNNLVEMGNLSSRPFISPLNENAFLFYRYYLQGSLLEEGKKIHKIKIVPKNSTDACFSGMIYIVDSTWRISSVDLQLTKDVRIQFVDTLQIRQLHAPVKGDSIWMPVALNFSFNFKAFGFTGGGYFNANLSDYDLAPVYEKRFFKDEVLVVQEGANQKDSAYWNLHRAIPLTDEERLDYIKKDSLIKIRDTDLYKDSTDHVTNKLRFRDFLLGYRFTKTKNNFTLNLPGLITNGIQYNTVEGLNVSYKFSADKLFEDKRQYNINGRVRYGFANQLWGGELGGGYLMDPKKRTVIGFKAKSIAEQYNRQEPLIPLVNSLYTLFMNENYMKLFRETGLDAFYSTEVTNGYFFTGTLRYMQRDALVNHSDLLFVDDLKKSFSSNNPLYSLNDAPAFTNNRAFTAEVNLLLRFRQKYYTLPDEKIITGSRFPRINIGYRKALPYLMATADYDLVFTTITDAVKLGVFGRLSYRFAGGYYLRNKAMGFMDYKHFAGNQTYIQTSDYLSAYRLLPYYTYSTNQWYIEAHGEHHFKGLILGRIPLIKKLKAQEVVGAHFLATDQLHQYYELNFGIERLWNVVRIDYVLGYGTAAKFKQGFTLSLDLSF
jgi:hypothetical protein